MHEPFKFSKIMSNSSPLINQWAIDNSVFLFDFDELMFQKDAELNLDITLRDVKSQEYKVVAVVECHPFFKEPKHRDERYAMRQEQLNAALTRYNLPAIFLTADWTLWEKRHNNKTFFPSWLFRLRAYAIENSYKEYPFSRTRKYNFSCCNFANLRPEKLHNYMNCFKRRRDEWYLTIYDHESLAISNLDASQIPGFSEEETVIWNNEIRPNLKLYEYDLLNGEQLNSFSTIFAGHTDAYANLVVEHSAEIEIASEKSFKPFIAEQVPVYMGFTGITKFVESLGFDVFTDFVDYTKYDAEDNFIDRIKLMHQEIDHVYATGIVETFFRRPDVISRLQKNKELFYSDYIDNLTITHLNRLIE